MKKQPKALKTVADQPERRKFPFVGVSWFVVGVSSVTVALCVAAGATDLLKGHVKVEQQQSVTAGAPDQSDGHHSARSNPANVTALDPFMCHHSIEIIAGLRNTLERPPMA